MNKFLVISLISLSTSTIFSQSCFNAKELVLKKKIEVLINVDSIDLIKCLLSFEKDKKYNYKWNRFTSDSLNRLHNINKSNNIPDAPLTNQVIALYLISSIYLGNFIFCDELVVLENNNLKGGHSFTYYKKATKRGESNPLYLRRRDKPIIQILYDKYKKWYYGLLKYRSICEAKNNNYPPPLSNTEYSWYKLSLLK